MLPEPWGGWLSRGVETPCGQNEEPQSGSLEVIGPNGEEPYLSSHLRGGRHVPLEISSAQHSSSGRSNASFSVGLSTF